MEREWLPQSIRRPERQRLQSPQRPQRPRKLVWRIKGGRKQLSKRLSQPYENAHHQGAVSVIQLSTLPGLAPVNSEQIDIVCFYFRFVVVLQDAFEVNVVGCGAEKWF